MSVDYSTGVVNVNILARKLQGASAKPNNAQEIYKLATDIMLECQRIREHTQESSQTKTLADYIKKVLT